MIFSGVCHSYPRHKGNFVSEGSGLEVDKPTLYGEEKGAYEEQNMHTRRLDAPDEDLGTVKQSARYGKIIQDTCQAIEKDNLCPYDFDNDEELAGGESVFYSAIPQRCVVCDYKNCCPNTISTCKAHEVHKLVSYRLIRDGKTLSHRRLQKNRIQCGCMNGVPTKNNTSPSVSIKSRSDILRRH